MPSEIVTDWVKVAKAAGEHGVRYRTNRALEKFLSDIAPKAEPFGYWVEHVQAEPYFIRPPAYIPSGDNYRVTPLYAAALASLPDRTGERVAEPVAGPYGDLLAEARRASAVVDNYDGPKYLIRRLAYAIEALTKRVAELEDQCGHWISENRRILKAGQDALDRAEAADAEQARLRERVVVETYAFSYSGMKEHNQGGYVDVDDYWAAIVRAEAAEARLAQAERATAVMVKPLEWWEVMAARSGEDPTPEHTGDYEAVTPFGTYYIEQSFCSDSYSWTVTINGHDPVADEEDPSAAKAAAQQDFEARIRSALEFI